MSGACNPLAVRLWLAVVLTVVALLALMGWSQTSAELPLWPQLLAVWRTHDLLFTATHTTVADEPSLNSSLPLSPAASTPTADVTSSFISSTPPLWLIATMSPYTSIARRQLIRATWQSLYNTSTNPNLTTRFVLAQPSPDYADRIAAENATYGDLWLIPDLAETPLIANTVKSMHMLAMLASGAFTVPPNASSSPPSSSHGWRYVSKVDDDSYIDPVRMWQLFIEPRLHHPRTLISRSMRRFEPRWDYPSGQFYTLSWDLLLTIVGLWQANHIVDEHEDRLIGRLLHEAAVAFTFVRMTHRQAFDYRAGVWDASAWAHIVGEGALNPHSMKSDEVYRAVAQRFDVHGARSTAFQQIWELALAS